MNGIDFMVRTLSGWVPPVPLPRSRPQWVDPEVEPVKPEEIEFIRQARGRLSTYALAECYGVSAQTISNIWAGRRPSCLTPRPARPQAKRKQP